MTVFDNHGFHGIMHSLLKFIILILFLVIYCEFLIYYTVLLSCSWPQLSKLNQDFSIKPPKDSTERPLRVMIISDTHITLSSGGDDFLRSYRRNWQLYRSFQSASFLFEPDIIFLIGDVSGQGDTVSDTTWYETVEYFRSLFSISNTQHLYVLPGNHDIGLHDSVTDGRIKRFEETFGYGHVRLITIDTYHVHFILINSMAFQGDHCRMCARAEKELDDILETLRKTQYQTRPVLLSHFPLFRSSNKNCSANTGTVSIKYSKLYTELIAV